MKIKKSPHILNSSANLLGFCLLILTSIKVARLNGATIIDDATGIASILLMASTIFSFLSIRSKHPDKTESFEAIADIAFFIALLCLTVTICLVSFNIFA